MIPELQNINIVDVVSRVTPIKKVSVHEWAGGCPRCGGHDRFRVNDQKGYFCRHCQNEPGSGGRWGDAVDFIMFAYNLNFRDALHRLGIDRKATPQEVEILAASRRAHEEEERKAEQIQQAAVHDRLTSYPEWRGYAEAAKIGTRGRDLWRTRGLSDFWIDYYALGYCASRQYQCGEQTFTSDSLTIPYFRIVRKPDGEFDHWHCIGLQHRLLVQDAPGGKYRPHLAGAGKHLFYGDVYQSNVFGDLLIVEGEIKAMVTWSTLWIDDVPLAPNLTVIGVPGKGWKEEWIAQFQQAESVTICLDPDATDSANRLKRMIGDKARVLLLPDKIDDLITAGVIGAEKLLDLLA
jgi:hypothetical protein